MDGSDPQLLTWRERVHDFVFGCHGHNWCFPISLKCVGYAKPYDSHQTCAKCGQTRYFNSKIFIEGPVFRKRE